MWKIDDQPERKDKKNETEGKKLIFLLLLELIAISSICGLFYQ